MHRGLIEWRSLDVVKERGSLLERDNEKVWCAGHPDQGL